MKNVQLGITILFGALAILGLFAFAGIIPRPGEKSKGAVAGSLEMWGIVNRSVMDKFLQESFLKEYPEIHVTYTQRNPDTFANGIIEALAAGVGPDLIILPSDLTVRFSTKVEPLTSTTYTERQFRDTFIQAGEIFIEPNVGILALPFSVDPMVMYWNRDIFANGNIVSPPKYWDEFLAISPILTKKNEAKIISQSAIAFGEYGNVTHSKDILAMLMLQTGNSMIIRQVDKTYLPVFTGREGINPPVNEVLRFYTDFSDPLNAVYSWNRSLPDSRDAFLAGQLAVYFGYASELKGIREKNPNLNFDVAVAPQVRDIQNKTTYGRVSGIAALKTSPKKSLALYAAMIMTSAKFSEYFSSTLATPPPTREVLAKGTADPFMKVFYDSAVISKTWLDLRPEKTSEIFRLSVESIVSGKETISGATSRLQSDFRVMTDY